MEYSNSSQQSTCLPRLLQLPLELRHEIYSYLCPHEPISNPIPTVGITSVSHKPPPTQLLQCSRSLHSDVLDYYHGVATWKLVASHAFNYYRIDPTLSNLASSRLLKRIQRVELVFLFDVSLLKNYPSFGTQKYCHEIRRRATRACEVLSTAPQLTTVRVTWADTTGNGNFEEKKHVLESLTWLAGKVDFDFGYLDWPGDVEADRFESTVRTLTTTRQPMDTVAAL